MDAELDIERRQFEMFKHSVMAAQGWRPFRTELCVAWRRSGIGVAAGQIDALLVSCSGQYMLLDFKRVQASHRLDANDTAFGSRTGLGPMSHLPDTRYFRYSLQLSIYNLMLIDTHGINVKREMYL